MINKITLIGRLGQDAEKQTLPSGVSYCRFSVATSESYKDNSGEWKEQTEWHNIIIWRDLADRAEKQLKKGSLVYIEGKSSTSSWQDKEGKTQYKTEVICNMFRNLEKSDSGAKPEPTEELPAATSGQITAMKIKVKRGDLTISQIQEKFSLTTEQLAVLRAEVPNGADDEDLPF